MPEGEALRIWPGDQLKLALYTGRLLLQRYDSRLDSIDLDAKMRRLGIPLRATVDLMTIETFMFWANVVAMLYDLRVDEVTFDGGWLSAVFIEQKDD